MIKLGKLAILILGLASGSAIFAQDQKTEMQWSVYVRCTGYVNYVTTYADGNSKNESGQRSFNLMIYDLEKNGDFLIQSEGLNEDFSTFSMKDKLDFDIKKENTYRYYKLSKMTLLYFDPKKFDQREKADGLYSIDLYLDRTSGIFSLKLNRNISYIADVNETGSFNCVAADQNTRKF
jgi:hypothetical protein